MGVQGVRIMAFVVWCHQMGSSKRAQAHTHEHNVFASMSWEKSIGKLHNK